MKIQRVATSSREVKEYSDEQGMEVEHRGTAQNLGRDGRGVRWRERKKRASE